MSKKSWAFQVDTFGNSNIYELSRINNQCHENHTTIAFLTLKLLVSSIATPRFPSWGFHSQEEERDGMLSGTTTVSIVNDKEKINNFAIKTCWHFHFVNR
jgi:hypothetical protein